MSDNNTTRTWIADLLAAFAGQNNTLTIPRIYITLTGSLEAALLLSQIIYWTDRATMDGNWFAKTYEEWEEELTLSKYQVMKAMKTLSAAGVETVVKKFNGSPTVHYRLNKVTFSQWIVEKLHYGKLKNFTIEDQKTSLSSTEPTTEPTTESPDLTPTAEALSSPIAKSTEALPIGNTHTEETIIIDGIQYWNSPTGEKLPFPTDQWGDPLPLRNPNIPTGEKLDTLKLDLATAYFFDMAYPPPSNRWSLLKMMTNFFTGNMQPDPKKKSQGEWYENQFEGDGFTADEIIAFVSWWEDQADADMKLQKPATIAEKAILFRLAEKHDLYLKAGPIFFEKRLNELYPPIQPVKVLASKEEIDALFADIPELA